MAQAQKPGGQQGPPEEVIQKAVKGQVNTFILILILILAVSLLIFTSKFFRVYITLTRMDIYNSSEIDLKSIIKNDGSDKNNKLRDYFIASAYRPYVCYYHKYDYVSVEVFKEVLKAGPRMIELEIFNSDFGDKVEPVVSIGTEDGEWTYTLNSVNVKEFLKAIASTVFNPLKVKGVSKDPFILFLNLKTNRNVKCLNKLHRYLHEILGQYLLGTKYAYNGKSNDSINDITLEEAKNKIIIFATTGFEDTDLEELINYSTACNYTLKYRKDQHRILYLNQTDIVENSEDIEDYVNESTLKLALPDVQEYNKYGFSILSPERGTDSLFDGISPYNPDPGMGLDAGCNFIMMNYQKIDTNMSNYMYIFKEGSFIKKKSDLLDTNNNNPKIFEAIKKTEIKLNQNEINYLYVRTNKQ